MPLATASAIGALARRNPYLSMEKIVPQSLLRLAFDAGLRKALLTENYYPALRRPLAAACFGNALVRCIDPRGIAGLLEDWLLFGGKRIDVRAWFLMPGDWDTSPKSLTEHPSFKRMADIASGVPFDEMPTYCELKAKEARGEMIPVRVAKKGGVDAYFSWYRALGDRMKSTSEMPDFGAEDLDPYIGIAIGRQGQILHHQGGRHRTCLARLLDCSKAKANVVVIHPLWARSVLRDTCCPYDAIVNAVAELSA